MVRWVRHTLVVCGLGWALSAQAGMFQNSVVPVVSDDVQQTEMRVAQKGDVLLETVFRPIETINLASDLVIEYDNRFGSRHDIPAAAVLYRAYIGDFPAAYCTWDHTFSQKPLIGGSWASQSCLADTDGDGRLDKEFSSNKNATSLPRLSLNLLWSEKVVFDPVAAVALENDRTAFVRSQVVLRKVSDKSISTRHLFQTDDDGEWVEMGSSKIKLKDLGPLPADVSLSGLEVRIHSVEDKALSYEILGSDDEPFLLGGFR